MVVGKIIGGLGNQMFQFVFYKYLSELKCMDLYLDINSFDGYKLHNGYELDKVFNINQSFVNANDVKKLKSSFDFLFRVENKIFNKNFLFGATHYKENKFRIDKDLFLQNKPNFYVEGYFQTCMYALQLKEDVKKVFSFNTILDNKEKALVEKKNSISIHIRGGDYLQNQKDKKLFGDICNYEYYKESIEFIRSKIDNPTFIVFSDDTDYAKKMMRGIDFNLVNWNKDENSYRDMFLMSQCKHNIIANSSFSWWGAYLNINSDKIVIAPKKWFNNKQISQKSIVPAEWIRI